MWQNPGSFGWPGFFVSNVPVRESSGVAIESARGVMGRSPLRKKRCDITASILSFREQIARGSVRRPAPEASLCRRLLCIGRAGYGGIACADPAAAISPMGDCDALPGGSLRVCLGLGALSPRWRGVVRCAARCWRRVIGLPEFYGDSCGLGLSGGWAPARGLPMDTLSVVGADGRCGNRRYEPAQRPRAYRCVGCVRVSCLGDVCCRCAGHLCTA